MSRAADLLQKIEEADIRKKLARKAAKAHAKAAQWDAGVARPQVRHKVKTMKARPDSPWIEHHRARRVASRTRKNIRRHYLDQVDSV